MLTGQYLLFWSNLFIGIYAQCNESSVEVEIVLKCPNTTKEWTQREATKNCSSISQNCTSRETFKYHCVRDSHLTKLIEVCAPVRTSAGYCFEYDEKGKVIQDNYFEPCTIFLPNCFIGYPSTDVYKYPACYELNKTVLEENITSHPHPTESRSLTDSDVIMVGLLSSFGSFILLAILVVGSIVFYKRIRKNDKGRRTTYANAPNFPSDKGRRTTYANAPNFPSGERRHETVNASNSDIGLQRMWEIHTADTGINEGRQVTYPNAPNFPSDFRLQKMWTTRTADVGKDEGRQMTCANNAPNCPSEEAYRHLLLGHPRYNDPTDMYDTQRSQSTTYGGSSSTCSSRSSGFSQRSLIGPRRYPILQNIYESR